MGQSLGEIRLSDPTLPTKQDVIGPRQEVEPVQFLVERSIGRAQQQFERFSVARPHRRANTHRERRRFAVLGQPFTDSMSYLARGLIVRLRNDECKLIAAVAHCGIDVSAVRA